jgi:hypothetical protein
MAPLSQMVDEMLRREGGYNVFCASLESDYGWPAGSASKFFSMSETYETRLRLSMLVHPTATKSDLRHKILPPLVESIYKDWSPQKQEYLVQAGVRTWFDLVEKKWGDEDVWNGFHECCTKSVNKQGFLSGPGDRALFGETVKQGNQYGSKNEKVYWSEDEEERKAAQPPKKKVRKAKGKGKGIASTSKDKIDNISKR